MNNRTHNLVYSGMVISALSSATRWQPTPKALPIARRMNTGNFAIAGHLDLTTCLAIASALGQRTNCRRHMSNACTKMLEKRLNETVQSTSLCRDEIVHSLLHLTLKALKIKVSSYHHTSTPHEFHCKACSKTKKTIASFTRATSTYISTAYGYMPG
jgi:hypothetical protein